MNTDADSKSDTGIRRGFLRPQVELFGDHDRERVFAERRKRGERRIDNLAEEERQLLLSEMPAPISGNRRR